jgi:hypothetical protein
MRMLLALVGDIDDLCQWVAPLYRHWLLHRGRRQRHRHRHLALSESLPLIVYFHRSPSRDGKHYEIEAVAGQLRPYFPALVSSPRVVALMPRALVPLCGYGHTRTGRCPGIPGVDSTSGAVCPTRRIRRHQGFAGDATRGKSSREWDFGCKLPLLVTEEGALVAFRVTTGEGDDRVPVWPMAEDRWGHL